MEIKSLSTQIKEYQPGGKFLSSIVRKGNSLKSVIKSQKYLNRVHNLDHFDNTLFSKEWTPTRVIQDPHLWYDPSELFVYGKHAGPRDIRELSYFMEREPNIKRFGTVVKEIEPSRSWYINSYSSKDRAIQAVNNRRNAYQNSGDFKTIQDVMGEISRDSGNLITGDRVELIDNGNLSKDSYPLYLKVLQRNHLKGVGKMTPVLDNGTYRMVLLNDYGMNPKSYKRIDNALNQLRTEFNLPDLPERVNLFGVNFVPAFRFEHFKNGGIFNKFKK